MLDSLESPPIIMGHSFVIPEVHGEVRIPPSSLGG
jgi:hypothetical protein